MAFSGRVPHPCHFCKSAGFDFSSTTPFERISELESSAARSSPFCCLQGWPPLRVQGGSRRSHFETHPFRVLQIGNDLKQVAGGRIAVWAKHLMKSLYVDLGMRVRLGKSDCGIDVITR